MGKSWWRADARALLRVTRYTKPKVFPLCTNCDFSVRDPTRVLSVFRRSRLSIFNFRSNKTMKNARVTVVHNTKPFSERQRFDLP